MGPGVNRLPPVGLMVCSVGAGVSDGVGAGGAADVVVEVVVVVVVVVVVLGGAFLPPPPQPAVSTPNETIATAPTTAAHRRAEGRELMADLSDESDRSKQSDTPYVALQNRFRAEAVAIRRTDRPAR
jgi:hypothetical protein